MVTLLAFCTPSWFIPYPTLVLYRVALAVAAGQHFSLSGTVVAMVSKEAEIVWPWAIDLSARAGRQTRPFGRCEPASGSKQITGSSCCGDGLLGIAFSGTGRSLADAINLLNESLLESQSLVFHTAFAGVLAALPYRLHELLRESIIEERLV